LTSEDAAAGALLAAEDRRDLGLLLVEHRLGGAAQLMRLARGGGVLAGAAPEDQRVEQRVGAEPVAAVDGDAGDLSGGVEAGDRGTALDVGLHAAHRVVVAGLDVDRLAGDVDAGEVAAHEDDLAQRLVHPLLRHHGDVERDGPSGKPRPSLISVCSARETTSREAAPSCSGVAFHEALAVRVQQVGALAARRPR
jgi:hypothetical protein